MMRRTRVTRQLSVVLFLGGFGALIASGLPTQATADGAYYLNVRGKINNNRLRQNIGGQYRGIQTGRYSSYNGYEPGTPDDEKVFVSGSLTSVPGTRPAESKITGYYPAWVVLSIGQKDPQSAGERKRTYVKVKRRYIIVGTFEGRLRMKKPFKVNERGRQRFRGRGVLRFDN